MTLNFSILLITNYHSRLMLSTYKKNEFSLCTGILSLSFGYRDILTNVWLQTVTMVDPYDPCLENQFEKEIE